MMCHLEAGDPTMSDQEAREALIGSISSSLHRLKDIDNQGEYGQENRADLILNCSVDGGFFVFGDVSVKTPGTHRLRFTLMELQKYAVA
jgi:hypothetical protein